MDLDNEPKVAIVIVNWNKKEFVISLLSSLSDLDYSNFDVIVVDNASSDDSVKAIKSKFADITLIENSENLGGTGGFNTGLEYALEKDIYQYIWLLDNDVNLRTDTLTNLIKPMEEDKQVGIAGSRIVDLNNKDMTVECGSVFRKDIIAVEPIYRNKKNLDTEHKIVDVDYVAICSALVRSSALQRTGIMDIRHFFFWDDMDWGLQFKKYGYRVVAIPDSVVYHPAFTEKRNSFTDFYYGTRNSLLTYSKFFGNFAKIKIFFNFLRHYCKIFIFLGLNNQKNNMVLGFSGIYDFIAGNWGQKTINLDLSTEKTRKSKSLEETSEARQILIINFGGSYEIHEVLKRINERFKDSSISLLVKSDRKDIFKDARLELLEVNHNRNDSLIHIMGVFIRILLRRFDIAITVGYPSPFSYAVKKTYKYDTSENLLIDDLSNLKNIWKLPVSLVAGELVGILLLPIIYLKSIWYKNS